MKKITAEELFNAGVHIGHKRQKVHPKAKKYIYTLNQGVSIIDVYKTAELLNSACEYISKLAREKKSLLIVATKRQAKGFIEGASERENLYYLTTKWIPGFLTNFSEMKKNLKKIKKMKDERDSGEWSKYPKHEQIKMEKKLNRIDLVYKHVENMTSLPDALFVVDIKRELNAVKEANSLSIPVVGICDTNANPSLVTYPIVANDDAPSSLEIIINAILTAFTQK